MVRNDQKILESTGNDALPFRKDVSDRDYGTGEGEQLSEKKLMYYIIRIIVREISK